MWSNVFKEVSGLLDRRFLINIFFPSLIFWGLLIIVILVMQGNVTDVIKIWEQQSNLLKTLALIALVAWVIFFSSILSSQITTLLRFYEGYWTFPLGHYLQKSGKCWYGYRLESLNQRIKANPNAPCYQDIYLFYPGRHRLDELMPTRLGNILKNAEVYPKLRYGIDSVLIWPRLYPLLPDAFLKTLAEAKSSLDFMLVLSFLGATFAIVSGFYGLVTTTSWQFFLVCFLGGFLFSGLAYRGAIGSALFYAHQIKVAFDLYRNELLKHLYLGLPENSTEERKQWKMVNQLLYRNIGYVDRYFKEESSDKS